MKPAGSILSKLTPIYLFFLVFLTYGSLVLCDFTGYDDAQYVFQNPLIRAISFENLSKIFFEPQFSGYSPLSFLSFMAEHSFFGVNPLIYHLTNLFLHFLVSVAVFYLYRALLRSDWGALFGASFFAVSPVQVETVAWISARKGLLCALFFFLSMLCFIHSRPDKHRKLYYLSLFFFAASLFSMVYAILLPLAFILGEREGWWQKRSAGYHLPFWILSGIFILIWLGFHPAVHTSTDGVSLGLSRIRDISFAVLFYPIKLIFPADLSIIYPRPSLDGDFFGVLYGAGPFFLLSALAGIIFFGKRAKAIYFGAVLYLLGVLPILPFFEHTNSMLQDHYAYIGSFGLFLMVGGVYPAVQNKKKSVMLAAVFLSALLTVTLSHISSRQCLVWKDTETLADHSLSIFPRLAPVYWLRGEHFRAFKEYDRALEEFGEAIRLRPEVYVAYEYRAKTWRELNRADLAAKDEDAVRALKASGQWKAVY